MDVHFAQPLQKASSAYKSLEVLEVKAAQRQASCKLARHRISRLGPNAGPAGGWVGLPVCTLALAPLPPPTTSPLQCGQTRRAGPDSGPALALVVLHHLLRTLRLRTGLDYVRPLLSTPLPSRQRARSSPPGPLTRLPCRIGRSPLLIVASSDLWHVEETQAEGADDRGRSRTPVHFDVPSSYREEVSVAEPTRARATAVTSSLDIIKAEVDLFILEVPTTHRVRVTSQANDSNLIQQSLYEGETQHGKLRPQYEAHLTRLRARAELHAVRRWLVPQHRAPPLVPRPPDVRERERMPDERERGPERERIPEPEHECEAGATVRHAFIARWFALRLHGVAPRASNRA
ncbi:hypothetical protein B0H13DRAFT_2309836 [Mycena leptocephala]|nr:hypothetical protein B0H13DRAFT_2309836 [Mycena leptocephala]